MGVTWPKRVTIGLRWLLAAFFCVAGLNHFIQPSDYLAIMPPSLPWPQALNAISGACEILGGVGILLRATRLLAGWGLIALLVAVFPANIFMAIDHVQPPGWHLSQAMLWLRLPLQPVLIAWVWWVAVRKAARDQRRAW